MKWGRASRIFSTSRLPWTVLVVVSLVAAYFAVTHRGVANADVELNDGGIWVTNQDLRIVGRLNYPSRRIDSALRTSTTEFDVSQAGTTVLLNDLSSGAMSPIDPSIVKTGVATSLPEGARAAHGGQRVAILDPKKGLLWAMSVGELAGFAPEEPQAVAAELANGQVAAAYDGTLVAASAESGRGVVIDPAGAIKPFALAQLQAGTEIEVSLVGSLPVVLDKQNNQLHLPDRVIDLGESNTRLQLPGPQAPHVLVASDANLLRVNLQSAAVEKLPAGGQEAGPVPGVPAAPARVKGCDYAAWAGSGRFLRLCADGAAPVALQAENLDKARDPRFRINRDLIVLNDTKSGPVWLADENMVLIDDWVQIDQDLEQNDEEQQSPQLTDEIADSNRQANNTPPDATDDEFGVRPGRTVLLPVHANDSDSDGDLLTAVAQTQPSLGKVRQVRGGAALQIEVAADARGQSSFVYEASDGRGGTDTATVRLTVRAEDENNAPARLRPSQTTVVQGARVEYNVLTDWYDPDGDPFYLAGATSPESMQVQHRAEGQVVVRDLNSEPGVKTSRISVSDGREVGEDELRINVREQGNAAPVANGDFYVARVGETLTVSPLANDVDPNNDRLRLVSLSTPPAGSSVNPSIETGTFDFVASRVGTYYLTYTVTDGPETSTGIVRIDVEPVDANAAPVAEDDLIVLPTGGIGLGEVLANDIDPSGGVLVIQSVSVPAGSPLVVTLVDHHLLRVTAPSGLEAPAWFSYVVSNGAASATGRVTVLPGGDDEIDLPPVAQEDKARVRVGDVASIAVLDNDLSPSGLALSLLPELQHSVEASTGLAFVTGNEVRFRAGQTPGTVTLNYTVQDTAGRVSSASVSIEIIAASSANSAPTPQDLTGWAVAGVPVRIPVPLSGIDSDGDSVSLVAIDKTPTHGTVSLGVGYIEYTPFESARGTDTFTYVVEDRLGGQGIGRVRVGVAPRSERNQVPTAVADVLAVRPGREVSMPVTANDIDPDGDPIAVVRNSVQTPEGQITASLRDNRIVFVSPSQPGTYRILHQITDNRGGVADGLLTVRVEQDAELRPPQARDDIVTSEQVVAAQNNIVRVDVRANDDDPDGEVEALTVSSDEPGVRVEDNQLLVEVKEQRQALVYTVTDTDGLSASALVYVPGRIEERPRINPARIPLRVKAGQEVQIDLRGFVITRKGTTPRITDPATISTAPGVAGQVQVRNENVLVAQIDPEFSGRTSISFEVTDGAAGEDRSGLTSTLTVPIDVRATRNLPPLLRPTPITVGAGEPPVEVDLRLMVEDPDGDDPSAMTYRMGSSPSEVSANLNGYMLTVSAGTQSNKGPVGSIEITVEDTSGTKSTSIPVTIAPSSRPLIQVAPIDLGGVNAGEPVTVDVASYATNPFPESPIEVVGSSVAVSVGNGQVDAQGSTITIRPDESQVGTMRVRFFVVDATGDPSRRVEGTVSLTVRSAPEAPHSVFARAEGASTAVVEWIEGDPHGAPVEEFIITAQPSGETFPCRGTKCTVSGLTNGVEYTFTVVARNAVGLSPSSGPSNTVLVDERPDTPAAPGVSPGDGLVRVSWQPPSNRGSAIRKYVVVLQPTGEVREVDAATLQTEFTGLTNGTAYTASVQAVNAASEPSQFSEQSAPAIPFGMPGPPAAVRVTSGEQNTGGGTVSMTISWDPPLNANGRPIQSYIVRYGSTEVEVPAGQLTHTVSVPFGPAFSAAVAARSEGGTSTFTPSGPVTALGPPPTPPTVGLTPTGNDGELAVSFSRPSVGGNGWSAAELSYEMSPTGAGAWRPLSAVVGGLSNGVPVSFQVRAVGHRDGVTYVSAASAASGQAAPYGPVWQPRITAQSEVGKVVFAINGAEAGNGRSVVAIEWRTPGGAATRVDGATAVVEMPGDPAAERSIEARACVADGACGGWVGASSQVRVELQVTDVAAVACPAPGAAQPALPPADDEDDEPAPPCNVVQFQLRGVPTGKSGVCTYTSDIDGASRTITMPANAGVQTTNWRTKFDSTGLFDYAINAGKLYCDWQ